MASDAKYGKRYWQAVRSGAIERNKKAKKQDKNTPKPGAYVPGVSPF